MTNVTIHDAKTHLSKYLLKVQGGEEIVLCRGKVPIAAIVPLPERYRPKRKLFGLGKGMGSIPPAFFEELSDQELPGFGL